MEGPNSYRGGQIERDDDAYLLLILWLWEERTDSCLTSWEILSNSMMRTLGNTGMCGVLLEQTIRLGL